MAWEKAKRLALLLCAVSFVWRVTPGWSEELSGAVLVQSRCAMCHAPQQGDKLEAIESVRKTPEGWELTVAGKLNLHGVEKAVSLPLQFHVEGDQLVAAGEVFLLQTEYGITPVTVAGGGVKVKDKLRIGFTIVAIKMNS